MKRIPLFKVAMSPSAAPAVQQTLESGFIGQGPRVDEFELALQKVLGTDQPPLTLNSCTSALDLALALIAYAGEYVISTPITCLATNMVIHNRGKRILWADVDPLTGNMDPMSVARIIGRHGFDVGAIVTVDWAGRPCDYKAIRRACGGTKPWIIEDAAHSFGAIYDGKPISQSGGDFVCWSFQAIKHLTTGDGGAILVPEPLYEKAKLLRWYGLDRTNSQAFRCTQSVERCGYKYHMNDIAATIGLANLELAQRNLGKHRGVAEEYTDRIRNSRVVKPPYTTDASWWLYTVLVDEPAQFIAHLDAQGIDASPVHARNDLQPCFINAEHEPNALATFRWPHGAPGVKQFADTEVCIPCGWWLTPEDVNRIVTAVNDF
jgi:dTDP-4-amino-4,6-dideoxygalactose transaminase